MTRTLLIGDTGGIGAAMAQALVARGPVEGLSRSREGFDYSDVDAVEARLAALDGPFQLILVTTGALRQEGYRPEKSLREITAEGLAAQFRVNALGPALILRHAPRLLPRDRRAVFAALSARVGSIGDNRLGGWYGYRAAKAALNQIIRTGAIELARSHARAICVALHPGTVETPLTEGYRDRHPSVPAAEAAANLLRVIDGLGPDDTGGFFDWAGRRVPW